MHPSVMEWVGEVVSSHGLRELSVLEVGAYDVNGSVRPLFTGEYLAIDTREGPGVDRVVDIESKIEWASLGQWDVVVSTEMLEHTPHPWVAVEGMFSRLKPGGLLVLTTRGFMFGHHDHGGDYYRWSVEGMHELLKWAGFHPALVMEDTDPSSPGVFAKAWRPDTV